MPYMGSDVFDEDEEVDNEYEDSLDEYEDRVEENGGRWNDGEYETPWEDDVEDEGFLLP
jgi:hypothetical protein